MEQIQWTTEKRQVSQLIPAEYNPRNLTTKQRKDLEQSLSTFNLADPIIVNLNNKVIGGHQRLKILQDKGIESIDVRVPNRQLTDKEEKELNLRLNKNTGEWDFDALANFDEKMILDVGFGSSEVQKIFDFAVEEKDDKAPELPEQANTKIGDIYLLGKHRLMCGDSTNKEMVDKLISTKIDAIVTDPPYGVNYAGKNQMLNELDKGNRIQKEYKNDEMDRDYYQFFTDIFKLPLEHLNEYNNIYVCMASTRLFDLMRSLKDLGCYQSIICVWVKNNHVLARTDYLPKHEFIWYGWKGKHKFYGKHKQSVFEYDKPLVNDKHPTMKPVGLMCELVSHFCDKEGIVYEPFGGSGTTLIAAEKLNRVCYTMEIDPKYCDVIVERWEEFTKQKAEKISG